MQFQASRISRDECTAGEWEARVEFFDLSRNRNYRAGQG
jgi:hypothetical protein